MKKGNYSVYHYDTHTNETGSCIGIRNVDVTTADKIARDHAVRKAKSKSTADKEVTWKRLQEGENCQFRIEGERMGYIVKKESQVKAPVQ